MADSIKISTQVLRDTAKDIRDYNQQMDDNLKQVDKTIDNLESTWKGAAGNAIRSIMNTFREKHFEAYRAVVADYAKFLDATAEQYEAAEDSIVKNTNQFH
ncbi:MAG: WXG100 family type VII secretion target [Lachnospiraceae bacterium]|nr:WXG100 family type VII secretion target [Lachnospiraceae bacterium]